MLNTHIPCGPALTACLIYDIEEGAINSNHVYEYMGHLPGDPLIPLQAHHNPLRVFWELAHQQATSSAVGDTWPLCPEHLIHQREEKVICCLDFALQIKDLLKCFNTCTF